MSDENISVSINAIDNLSSGIGSAERSLSSLGGTADGVAGSLKSLGEAILGAFAVDKLIEQGKKAIEAFTDLQRSTVLLQSSIHGLGISFESVAPAVNETVHSMTEFTRFTKEETQGAISRLVDITQDLNGSLAAMPTIADFATARNIELGQAADLVSKAAEGVTTGLRRAGIVMDATTKAAFEAADENTRLTYTLDLLAARFGGRAAADVASYSGQMAQFKKEVHEVYVEIGENLLNVLIAAKDGMKDIVAYVPALSLAWAAITGKPMSSAADDLADQLANQRILRSRQDQGKAATPDQQKALAAMASDLQAGSMIADKAYTDALAAAQQEADRVAKVYQTTLASLYGTVSDAATKEAALRAALAQSAAGFEINEKAARGLADALHDYSALAALPTNTLAGIMNALPTIDQRTNEQLDNFIGKFDPEKFRAQMADAQTFIDQDWAADFAKRMKEQSVSIGKQFSTDIVRPMTSAFEDLANTGGKNFAQVFSNYAKEGITDLAKFFSNQLGSLFGGGKTPTLDPATGQWMVGSQAFGSGTQGKGSAQQFANDSNMNSNALVSNILKGLGGLAALGQAATTPGTSPISTTILGATTGFALGTAVGTVAGVGAGAAAGATAGSVYPIVGTIIGAIIGALAGLLAPSKGANYKYGIPEISGTDGSVTFSQTKGLDANTIAKYEANIESSFNNLFNGFQKILITLNQPVTNIQQILGPNGLRPVVGRFEEGADLGNAASEGFATELQNWIDTGMPKELAAKFYGGLSHGFQQYGFSADAFKGIFDTLMGLDPQKAIAALGELATAAVTFQKTLAFFALPTGFGGPTVGPGFTSTASGLGTSLTQQATTVPQQIAQSDVEILKLSNALKDLTGQERIDAFSQLAQMTDARYQAELAFIKQIKDTIDSITQNLENQKFGYKLAGLQKPDGSPDVTAQIALLKGQLDALYGKISSETDPNKLATDVSQAQQIIGQIVSLGGNTQAFDKWGQDAVDQLEKESTRVLNSLGNAIDQINTSFMAQFQPSITEFMTGIKAATTPLTYLGPAVDDTVVSIHNFKLHIDDASDALAGLSGNSHTNTTQGRRAAALG